MNHHGLAARYFTDSSVFKAETLRFFRTHWLCAARADQVQAAHAFLVVQIEDASILVVRGDDQQLRAFHNVCRHRGALLCSTESGTLKNECVTCPYHAWAYNQQGALARAPNMQGPEWDSEQYGLHEVGCAEWNGYVMIRLGDAGNASEELGAICEDATSSDFNVAFAPVKDQFQPWSMDELTMAHRLDYEVNANWKLLFHNFSECYHCPTVHPALNRLTPFKSAKNDLMEGAFLGGPMMLVDGVQSMSQDGAAVAAVLPSLNPQQQRQVGYYTLYPTMFISPHPDYVMVHRLYRRSPQLTSVVCEFLMHPDEVQAGSGSIQSAAEFWDETNRQDWRVCELVQQGAQTSGFTPGVYSPLETVLPELDRYYRSVMGIED